MSVEKIVGHIDQGTREIEQTSRDPRKDWRDLDAIHIQNALGGATLLLEGLWNKAAQYEEKLAITEEHTREALLQFTTAAKGTNTLEGVQMVGAADTYASTVGTTRTITKEMLEKLNTVRAQITEATDSLLDFTQLYENGNQECGNAVTRRDQVIGNAALFRQQILGKPDESS